MNYIQKLLSNRIILEILSNVSDIDLCKSNYVNKKWKEMSDYVLDQRWKKLYQAVERIPHKSEQAPLRTRILEAMISANFIQANSRMGELLNRIKNDFLFGAIVKLMNDCPEIGIFFHNPASFLYTFIFNEPLENIWNQFKRQNPSLCNAFNHINTADDIRKCLKTTEAQEIIPHIKKIDLSNQNILMLPPEFGQFIGLEEINLSNNQLITLPSELGKLIALKELNLSCNKLTVLPEWIGRLINLEKINLSNNQLITLPSELGKLIALKELNLSCNKLTVLPEWIGRLINLVRINLCDNELIAFPMEIRNLVALTELYLSNNQLTSLSVGITQLTSLKKLYLDSNKLTALPEWIGQLDTLEELKVGDNELITLPLAIWQLITLEYLDLSNNQLNFSQEDKDALNREGLVIQWEIPVME